MTHPESVHVAVGDDGIAVLTLSRPEVKNAIDTPMAEALARALEDRRVAVVAAGDLSAGLTPKAPLTLVEGATAWEEEVVDVVAGGRLERVARMGPGEAARVGALGWAPLVVLAGVCRAAAIGMVVRHHAAPRGVGYLVASGG